MLDVMMIDDRQNLLRIQQRRSVMCTNTDLLPVNPKYKARIFELLYQDKKELLDLYNAVNGTSYEDPEELEINTLENAVYMAMHNDVSFVIGWNVSLYEHQSTFSPNLPLRFLFYMSDLYSAITRDDNLYGEKLIKVPAPKFIIFYNGIKSRPEREVLTLSAMYQIEEEEPELELKATLLNINIGYNEQLKRTCKSLGDYCEYTGRVRAYAKEMPIEEAVERAITECIREGILADFLSRNRTEAKKVSIYEYDEEKHLRMEREQSYADGLEQGIERGIEQGIERGIEQGIEQEQYRMAQEMYKKGFPLEQISELIGVDKEQIEQWCKEEKKE